MGIIGEDYHIWQRSEYTEDETDEAGHYLCTDRGVFKVSEDTIELHGYTFGVVDLWVRPAEDFYNVVGLSPVSREIFTAM